MAEENQKRQQEEAGRAFAANQAFPAATEETRRHRRTR